MKRDFRSAASWRGFPHRDDIRTQERAAQENAPVAEGPSILRLALASRGGRIGGRPHRLALVECASQSVGSPHLNRLRLSRPRGRNAHRRHLAPLQSKRYLPLGLCRRHRQHAARRHDRHRACNRARHDDRHRATLVQLAAVATFRRLCGGAPRYPPPPAIVVLVRADARVSAGAGRMEADRRRVSFQSRPCFSGDSDRIRSALGARQRCARIRGVLHSAAQADRIANAGRPRAAHLAIRADTYNWSAGASFVVARRILDGYAARTSRISISSAAGPWLPNISHF
jgi:hypothetical protein